MTTKKHGRRHNKTLVKNRVQCIIEDCASYQIKCFKTHFFVNRQTVTIPTKSSFHWLNKNTGEITNTYTILTTAANPLMAEIHNTKKRMPVILKRSDESKWLQQEPLTQFAFPYDVSLVATKANP